MCSVLFQFGLGRNQSTGKHTREEHFTFTIRRRIEAAAANVYVC